MLAVFAVGTWISVRIILAVNHKPEHEGADARRVVDPGASPVEPIVNWLEDTRHQARHFHQTMHREFPDPRTLPSCLTCHHPLPHRKDRARRSFFNQHARFMTCLVCHLSPTERARSQYRWSQFDVDLPKGSLPYGVRRGEDGMLSGQQNLVAHIVPIRLEAGREVDLVETFMDASYLAYRKDLARGKAVDKEGVRAKAEALVGGPALSCVDCHTPNGVMPLRELGFSEDRIRELENSSAVTMVESKEEFHFTPLD